MKSPLLGNVLTLVTGNAVAFIIPVLLYPFLSRIFSQEDYALFGLYIAVFSFLEVASAGRYDHAILIPHEEKDSLNLMVGGLWLSLFYAALVFLLVLFFRESVAEQLKSPSMAKWLFLLPVTLPLVSVSKIFTAWLIRNRNFKAASVNKASQKIAEATAQVTLGLTVGNGLLLGDLAGRIFIAAFSVFQGFSYGFSWGKINSSLIKVNLSRYSDFPKYNILPSMLNALGGMTPVFVVSYYFSTGESGSFNFSRLLLSVPFALISSAVSQVIMQQVSQRRHRREKCSGEVYDLGLKLVMVSIVGAIPLLFFGPELFAFIFGDKWTQAGRFTTFLILSYAVSFIISPFSAILVVLEKIKWISTWQIFYFVVVSALWFFEYDNIIRFLVILVCIDIVSYLLYGFLIRKALREYERDLAIESA